MNSESRENMFEIHKQVENIYSKNKDAFEVLGKIFLEEYSIPLEVTRDEVKRRILGGLENQLPSKWLHSPKGFIHSLAMYLAAMAYLLWCALFGTHYPKAEVDVLFDYWVPTTDKWYAEIIENLPALKIAAISPSFYQGYNHSLIPASNMLVRKPRPFSRKAAQAGFISHFRRFNFYWDLTKQTNIDFVDLGLRLCADVVRHISNIDGITAKILVSANDNGYSPYRYHLYRSNGVGSIFLIQNGGRVALTEFFNSYIYSDFYIGWSQQRMDDFVEMRVQNKIAMGPLLLSKFLLSRGGEDTGILYDIVFIEQPHSPVSPQHVIYLKLLQNLARFSVENPEIRVAYSRRRDIHEFPSLSAQFDAILRESAVAILDVTSHLSSYENVLRSSVVVSFDSSMRCEAILLGKPVLSCTYRHDDFIVKYSDPCLVSSDDYGDFSHKLEFLLSNLESPTISDAFARQRKTMDEHVVENVPQAVANLIKSELATVGQVANSSGSSPPCPT